MLSSRHAVERAGSTVRLKAENLQRTGSFKLRGALNKLAALGDGCAGRGRGQRRQPRPGAGVRGAGGGVRCEVFMPEAAPIAKVDAARASAPTCTWSGRASTRRSRPPGSGPPRGLAFVHPFDDPDVIAGQAGLGLELLDEVPDLARVLVPVGGGGLVSGVAIALKSPVPRSR